ncbi:MAG: carbamoyl phosphate synthase small subunit [Erysipelotrichaceae bacterium]|nr:carbamoyl phosphate synthase small subunit [Erysipelotrichaceae bacterium]
MKKRLLLLEDGSVYEGLGFGADEYKVGELIFNTSMSGYQEILSDLAYCGQIVLMTYPLIGNYGINRDDFESLDPAVFGFVVKEYCTTPSNFRCDMDLDAFLKLKHIPGICHIDTRAITRKLRTQGTMCAVMADGDADVEALLKQLRAQSPLHDQVQRVASQKPFPIPARGHKVVLMDFGVKHGIIRELTKRSCDLVVVPYDTKADAIMALHPDGVVISSGPGDPKDMQKAICVLRELMGKVAMLGIGLGHELIALACGADTYKLHYGHHGSGPVKDLRSGKILLAEHNHDYAVVKESLVSSGLKITHSAPNDDLVEGFMHERYPVMGVQFYPEASPGPEDANGIFDTLIELMEQEGK